MYPLLGWPLHAFRLAPRVGHTGDFADRSPRQQAPDGCRDLSDVIGVDPQSASKMFLKLPLLHSKPRKGVYFKQPSAPHAIKGDLFVSDDTTVKELAALLGEKDFQIIADAMQLGIFATVNQSLGFKAISQIAEKYGYAAKKIA
jgi:hypothetical protein